MLLDLTDKARRRAGRRRAAIILFEDAMKTGVGRGPALDIAANLSGASRRSVERWLAAARDGADKLADRKRTGRPAKVWEDPAAAAAWDVFRADYLRVESPPLASVWERTRRAFPACPSLATFRRRVAADVPALEAIAARRGLVAAQATLPHLERSVSDLQAMEVINGDGRRLDVMCRFPDGTEGRPVLWVWQDVKTRRILSWAMAKTETADLIRSTLSEILTKIGRPDCVVIDGTRAASAKWLVGGDKAQRRWRGTSPEVTGILPLLGIRAVVTGVDKGMFGDSEGRGRAKPVERAFSDLKNHVELHPNLAGAHTGRVEPGMGREGRARRAAPLADIRAVLDAAIVEHNARPGRRTEAALGRSFDDAWADEAPRLAALPKLTTEQYALLLPCEVVTVNTAGTFRLRLGRRSGSPLSARYGCEELRKAKPWRAVVRYQPSDLACPIHVFDSEGRYLAAAEAVEPVPFNSVEAAQAHQRAREAMRKAARKTKAVSDQIAADKARKAAKPEIGHDAESDAGAKVLPLRRRAGRKAA